jgi:hypothetical protein
MGERRKRFTTKDTKTTKKKGEEIKIRIKIKIGRGWEAGFRIR